MLVFRVGPLLLGACAITASQFDGTVGLWNSANGHAIVEAPLPMEVEIARPTVQTSADGGAFTDVELRFTETLRRALATYAKDKRVFQSCCETEGAYSIRTTIHVARYSSGELQADARWELVSPDGKLLLSREQPIAQRLETNGAFDDRFGFHEFLNDTARLWTEQLARTAAPPPTLQTTAVVIAAFDIEDPAGVLTEGTRDQVTEYLTVKLAESRRFRVVPRAQLKERLRESKKESYRACYDDSCQIEIGKSLAAAKTVATKVLKLGTQCVLTCTMFDLTTEATDAAASVTVACANEALIRGVDDLVAKLTAAMP